MKIDPTYLDELSHLSFRIKRKIFDRHAGDERTINTGDGLTFKDHAQYSVGDDVRRIDWKVYARTGEIYIRRYESDRNVTLHTLLDASASMDYGVGDANKFMHAAKLALATAYIMGKHQGKVRFATFSERLHEAHTISGSATLSSMLRALEKTSTGGQTALLDSLVAYKRSLQTKSSLIIFSDMLAPIEQIQDVFSHFARSKLILVQLAHPDELSLKFRGDFKLSDAETGAKLRMHISPRFSNEYEKRFYEHLQQIDRLCEQFGANFVQLNTSESCIANFMRIWEKM